jgi:acetylornithine deacetylase/succinyl-diaminopimelate desuccinylase-like protein
MGGMKDLIDDLPEAPDACISVDSGSMQGIIYEATGMRTMEVRFHGVGGHAFGAFGQAAQPLHAAARAVAKIADLPVPADPRTTYCVSGFHAGSDAGIHAIPPLAVIKVNYRSNSPEQLEKLDKAIFGAIQAACDEETARWGRDRITWDAKQYIDIPAGTQDPHSPVVESLYAALAEVEVTPRLLRGGATNSSIAIARGLPAVCMGTAWHPDGQEISTMDHTLAEFFPVAGAYKGVQAALLTALLCAGTRDTPSLLKR